MFYAIATTTRDETFLKKGTTFLARKGWLNEERNEPVRERLQQYGYNVVIAQFDTPASAREYVASLN